MSLCGKIGITDTGLLYLRSPNSAKGRVYVSVFAILAFIAVLLSENSAYPSLFVLSAALHECAHIFSLKLVHSDISRICVYPFGADIRSSGTDISYFAEIFTVISGVLCNLLLSVLSALLYRFIPDRHILFFCFANAFLALSNIIPVRSLDGGRALELILCEKYGPDRAYGICSFVSWLSYGIMCCFFMFLFLNSGCNLFFMIILIYTVLCAFFAEKLTGII